MDAPAAAARVARSTMIATFMALFGLGAVFVLDAEFILGQKDRELRAVDVKERAAGAEAADWSLRTRTL